MSAAGSSRSGSKGRRQITINAGDNTHNIQKISDIITPRYDVTRAYANADLGSIQHFSTLGNEHSLEAFASSRVGNLQQNNYFSNIITPRETIKEQKVDS